MLTRATPSTSTSTTTTSSSWPPTTRTSPTRASSSTCPTTTNTASSPLERISRASQALLLVFSRDRSLIAAVGAAEEGDGVGGLGVGVALDARPGTALGMPEVALEAVGLVGVGSE